MEFLLRLDAGAIRRERAELRRLIANSVQQWTQRRMTLTSKAGNHARFSGIPVYPTADFVHASDANVEVLQNDEWTPIGIVRNASVIKLKELEALDIPSAEVIAPQLQEQLVNARAKVDQLTTSLVSVRADYGAQLQDLRAIESRIKSLEIDLRRNQDALKLRQLGSALGQVASEGRCPTCHQSVTSELLPALSSVGMAIDENISFIKSQLQLYQASLQSSSEQLADYKARYEAIDQSLRDAQREIRTLRQALIQPSSAPSRAVIEQTIHLQVFVDSLRSIQEAADGMMDELRSIATRWAELQERLKRLPLDDFTNNDKEKVDALETSVKQHLALYGFKSFQPNEISLSRDNFRTLVLAREGDRVIEKEINFEVSASDAIRLKWAYYLSMLAVSARMQTNHCGLTIFDEPGQQEVEPPSLDAFLRWSSVNLTDSQQIVVATSEQQLAGAGHIPIQANVIRFEGFILQPL
jgi:hypothetical protein